MALVDMPMQVEQGLVVYFRYDDPAMVLQALRVTNTTGVTIHVRVETWEAIFGQGDTVQAAPAGRVFPFRKVNGAEIPGLIDYTVWRS